MSWEQLRDITQANAQEQAYWRSQPPLACPNDGTPLIPGAAGVLACTHDGWQYPRDWVPPQGY